MPRVSERQRINQELNHFIEIAALEDLIGSDEESDSDAVEHERIPCFDDDLYLALAVKDFISSNRYLNPRLPIKKSCDFLEMFCLHSIMLASDKRCGCQGKDFLGVASLISKYKGFFNQSMHPQKPLDVQLAVALYRFSHFGKWGIPRISGRKFGISEGAADYYVNRVIAALMDLLGAAIKWPAVEEKSKLKRRIFMEYGFPNCVGYVDGTLIVLDSCPPMNGEDYFSRKKLYGLSAMVVCDDRRKILYAFSGFVGSAHDNRVFNNSGLCKNQNQFFLEDEYLIADSGYACSNIVIAAYKAPATNVRENADFNTYLAAARVVNEHMIGVLKGRFQSLRGLRILIRNKRSHARATLWFLACCVLHNILEELNEVCDEEWDFVDVPGEDEMDAGVLESGPMDDGKRKRENVNQND